MALLSHCRKVAADLPKDNSALIRSKAAGDLLANLGHSKVSLSQIVIIGNGKIVHERQYFVALCQPFGQVAPFCLSSFSAFSRSCSLRICVEALLDKNTVASLKIGHCVDCQRGQSLLLGSVDPFLNIQQQRLELFCPDLAFFFVQERQFPPMVYVAGAVFAVIVSVRGQRIVYGSALESGKYADFIHGDTAALGMCCIVRQLLGAGDMQPMELAVYALPCLIEMRQWRLFNRLLDRFGGRLQNLGTLLLSGL